MVRKKSLYSGAILAWFLLTVGTGVVVLFGFAEPYVTPEAVPYGVAGTVALTTTSAFVGISVLFVLRNRSWAAAGREIGLEPQGWPLFGMPALAGTVDGRPVRVDTYEIKTGGGTGDSAPTTRTYTLVETVLDDPVEPGFFLGSDAGASHAVEDEMPGELGLTRIDDDHYVWGDVSEAAARDLLTGDARDAFRAGAGSVVVGDPTDVIVGAFSGGGGALGGAVSALAESLVEEAEGFDAGTVAHSRRGRVLEADRLRAQVEAVAAVADAHARAEAETRTA
jgi:hypothetical protein